MIDLRSDTVTKPTPAMRRAMRFITTSRDGERQERTLTSQKEYAEMLREHFDIVMIN